MLKIVDSAGSETCTGGDITYENGILEVGPARGWFSLGEEKAWRLPVL